MKTIRIKRKLKSTLLRIRELQEYKGKNIELKIIVKELFKSGNSGMKKSLSGSLSSYADSKLIDREKMAWESAVNEKHGNYRR